MVNLSSFLCFPVQLVFIQSYCMYGFSYVPPLHSHSFFIYFLLPGRFGAAFRVTVTQSRDSWFNPREGHAVVLIVKRKGSAYQVYSGNNNVSLGLIAQYRRWPTKCCWLVPVRREQKNSPSAFPFQVVSSPPQFKGSASNFEKRLRIAACG